MIIIWKISIDFENISNLTKPFEWMCDRAKPEFLALVASQISSHFHLYYTKNFNIVEISIQFVGNLFLKA